MISWLSSWEGSQSDRREVGSLRTDSRLHAGTSQRFCQQISPQTTMHHVPRVSIEQRVPNVPLPLFQHATLKAGCTVRSEITRGHLGDTVNGTRLGSVTPLPFLVKLNTKNEGSRGATKPDW